MNILITGVAGFIGFSLAKKLLSSKKNVIYGIDNINDYYSPKLKNKRIKILKENRNFYFLKNDINESRVIIKKLKNIKLDIIFHFAAQAGVRYTIKAPKSYIHSNQNGFINFLKVVEEKNPKQFLFASSSSVYGDAKQFPVKEKFRLNPKNLYAKTKKFNEDYAIKKISNKKMKVIALRLFTIYGEWGRPDMLILKFLQYAKNKKVFELNNNGDHFRDFTYIGSAIKLIIKLTKLKQNKKFEIYNVCSSKPIKVLDIINDLKKITGYNKIKVIPVNKLEVYKTYGDNSKILSKVKNKFNFTPIKLGVKNTYKWFREYKKYL